MGIARASLVAVAIVLVASTVRAGDDPELAKPLRVEERELDAGGRN